MSATPTSSLSSKTERILLGRSRVLEYMQQSRGACLPEHPVMAGRDRSRLGVEYVLWIAATTSLANCAAFKTCTALSARNRSGGRGSRAIGDSSKPVSGQSRSNKLRAYNIPLSKVIEKVRASTNRSRTAARNGRSAIYDPRPRYLVRESDFGAVPVVTKNGTAVLVRDLGISEFWADIREGVANGKAKGRPSQASWSCATA